MKTWLGGLVLFLLPMVCRSQGAGDALTRRLDEVVSSTNGFMGTVLVAEGDRKLLSKGYGKADLEWDIANGPDVKFRLGSLTKQFTATLVLLLQQEGRLRIEDPVSHYLADAPKTWSKITLADLLGHTSGIPNFTDEKEFTAWRMNPWSKQELIGFFRDKPLKFEPGSKFEYSNSNYEVLGAVIEKVTGGVYGDLLRDRLFTPLGMKESGLDTDELILRKRAQGYMPGKEGLVHARSESMTIPWAAGSLYSTTGDLLRWEQALFGGKVLSESSLKRMTTPGKGGYGLGVQVKTLDGMKVIEHGGGIEGFNTYLCYVPERRLTVVVLANVNGDAPDRIGAQLRSVAFGKAVVLPSERTALPVTKDELARYAGVYDLAPAFALTVTVGPENLTIQGSGQPALPVFYEGNKDGHARFFARAVAADFEFVPDAEGKIQSLILHQNGRDLPARKR